MFHSTGLSRYVVAALVAGTCVATEGCDQGEEPLKRWEGPGFDAGSGRPPGETVDTDPSWSDDSDSGEAGTDTNPDVDGNPENGSDADPPWSDDSDSGEAGTDTDTGRDGGTGSSVDTDSVDGIGPGCPLNCLTSGFHCCGSRCVNLDNDIFNCGKCGNACEEDFPYCDEGTCAPPPCTAGACAGNRCCGDQCCQRGQLCCKVPGPILNPLPMCTIPTDQGTCDRGCKICAPG